MRPACDGSGRWPNSLAGGRTLARRRPARHTGAVTRRVRTAVRVEGIVQGVGFRPFVFALARRLGLGGLVGNDVDGVFAEVEGLPEAIEEFLLTLRTDAPPLARVERIITKPMEPNGCASFSIAQSGCSNQRHTPYSSESATCIDYLPDIADRHNRRFDYPFIKCTNCGP